MDNENHLQPISVGKSHEGHPSIENEELGVYPTRPSIDKEAGLATCRVCQCAESDRRGEAALEFLDITPPLQAQKSHELIKTNSKEVLKEAEDDDSTTKNGRREYGFVEFVSPQGEVFICNTDIEMGSCHHQDTLIELGCSCKNDLALVHYACALKWFVNHGSTICEICGSNADNVRTVDFKKVVGSLKEYEALRERTASGEPVAQVQTNSVVDPDAAAAIRRQRLSEISLWFNPHNNNNNNSSAASQVVSEQHLNIVAEDFVPAENPATKWAVEGTGILLATGLLTVTLAWLIAPRVGKVWWIYQFYLFFC